MRKAFLAAALVILISGCTTLPQKNPTETKIQKTTGIGVLEFRPVVSKMLTSTYNYILLTIRNNAAGSNAKNIVASLENVDPFKMYECNAEHDPSDERESVCNDFFDDMDVPYKAHKINEMLPDEEVQFFWNIKSPDNKEIGGMAYTHTIYYTLKYDYTSTVTQTIACISQDEYLKESKKGPVTLSGKTIRSPGEIRIESKTQQPIIYISGSEVPTDFNIEFEIVNSGGGVPEPGSNILIAFKKDALTGINGQAFKAGWYPYSKNNKIIFEDYCNNNDECLNNYDKEYCNEIKGNNKKDECLDGYDSKMSGKLTYLFDKIFDPIQFPELGPVNSATRQGMILTLISSSQMSGGNYHLSIPVEFYTSDIYEPQKTLTFSAYMAYTYLKEGSTSINVYPPQ